MGGCCSGRMSNSERLDFYRTEIGNYSEILEKCLDKTIPDYRMIDLNLPLYNMLHYKRFSNEFKEGYQDMDEYFDDMNLCVNCNYSQEETHLKERYTNRTRRIWSSFIGSPNLLVASKLIQKYLAYANTFYALMTSGQVERNLKNMAFLEKSDRNFILAIDIAFPYLYDHYKDHPKGLEQIYTGYEEEIYRTFKIIFQMLDNPKSIITAKDTYDYSLKIDYLKKISFLYGYLFYMVNKCEIDVPRPLQWQGYSEVKQEIWEEAKRYLILGFETAGVIWRDQV